jgi:hypothetical protein
MGKSKEQKQSEAGGLKAQQQQLASNTYFQKLAETMQTLMKEREAKETAYLEGQVDPLLAGYAKTGFAPGERNRLRSQVSEDVGRAYTGAGNADAPSGTSPYLQSQLARSRGESLASGQRGIEQMGSERRFNTIPAMFSRAGMYNPLGYNQAVNQGRAQAVQRPQIQKGFWQELGSGFAQAIPGAVMGAATGGISNLISPNVKKPTGNAWLDKSLPKGVMRV